jgi:hypothetical protein
MGAVQRLCKRSILIDRGYLTSIGPTLDVVPIYLSQFSFIAPGNETVSLADMPREGIGSARFVSFHHQSPSSDVNYRAFTGGPLDITVGVEADSPRAVTSLSVTIHDEYGTILVNTDTLSNEQIIDLKAGVNFVHIKIESLYLLPGFYHVGFWVANPPGEVYDWIKTGVNIEVVENNSRGNGIRVAGMVMCNFKATVEYSA